MKILKKAALTCAAVLLLGCTGYTEDTVENGIRFHISPSQRKAFVSEVEWPVREASLEVEIPERVSGVKVTSLGGFFGTGVPSPFELIPVDPQNAEPVRAPWGYGLPVEIEEIPVTVRLPSTITEMKLLGGASSYVTREDYGILLIRQPVFQVECDEANPTYRSENGKLYDRKTGEEINLNGDSGLSLTLKERLTGRCYREFVDGEKEVYDFFEAFGTIWVHINTYQDDSEYMFSAMELTPLSEEDLNDSEGDVIRVSAKVYSDFANAGQYTDAEFPYYEITVNEDSIVLVGLDADQNPVLNSGIELDRDNHQPSQFPWNTDELRDETKLPGDPRAMSFYRFEPLTSGIWNCDAYELRIHEDGAVNLKLNGTETAVVYRGIVCASEGEDGFRLAFALTKNGGTTEPFVGTCELVFNDDQTITLKTADDALPLIPEGSNEVTLQR